MAELVMVRSMEVRTTRKGDRFGSLRLNRGRQYDFEEIDSKIWGLDAVVAGGHPIPAPGDLLRIAKFKADEYNGKPQWILHDWAHVPDSDREKHLPDFVPPVRVDETYYYAQLEKLIARVAPESAAGMVLRSVYDDPDFREAFYLQPAAVKFHQNYAGGLLEHTVNVTTLALALADAYAEPGRAGLTVDRTPPPIDRNVLVAAGLLHDIGKLETYTMTPLPEMTDMNRWEGHLVISYAVARERARPLMTAPPYPGAEIELQKLLHCILAHHGTLEFGSPVAPSCLEAYLLAQADMTDARVADIMQAATETRDLDPSARWIQRQLHFPGGVFIGDWPETK